MASPTRMPLAACDSGRRDRAIWQLLESAGLLHYEYLPAPVEVLASLVGLTRTGELVARCLAHARMTLIATITSLTLGAALGLAIGLLPTMRIYVVASIDFLRAIPAVALVPVAVIAFGPSVTTELMLVTYAALWPVVLCTAAGVAAMHPRQYDIARMLHLSRLTTIRKIVIPAAVPAWLIGARLSAVIALLVSIVAEMLMIMRGLGGGLVQSLNALAPARMWAYVLVCGVIGFALNALLGRAVRLVLPGSPANADGDIRSGPGCCPTARVVSARIAAPGRVVGDLAAARTQRLGVLSVTEGMGDGNWLASCLGHADARCHADAFNFRTRVRVGHRDRRHRRRGDWRVALASTALSLHRSTSWPRYRPPQLCQSPPCC